MSKTLRKSSLSKACSTMRCCASRDASRNVTCSLGAHLATSRSVGQLCEGKPVRYYVVFGSPMRTRARPAGPAGWLGRSDHPGLRRRRAPFRSPLHVSPAGGGSCLLPLASRSHAAAGDGWRPHLDGLILHGGTCRSLRRAAPQQSTCNPPARLRSLFRHHRRTTGIRIADPHRFRHTFACDMVRAGISYPH